MSRPRKRMGRPPKKIDEKLLDLIAMTNAPMREIAAALECSVDTLERRYAARIAEKREAGKTSIRRKQYELALKGDKTMLIWLGKQWLGQTDTQHITTVEGKPEVHPPTGEELNAEVDELLQELIRRESESEDTGSGPESPEIHDS